MNKVYILGGAQTDFERNWKKEGKGLVALLKEVISDGLSDAGVSFDDIKELNKENRVACFVGNFIAEKYIEQGHLGAFLTEVIPFFMVFHRQGMRLLVPAHQWQSMQHRPKSKQAIMM